jgi:glycosyltransferase involved in cell wall biosynthesis
MDLKPTVSVIIPTYNRAHLIGRAIQSVLKQTYQDFEVIVVDDGSIDNTEEVVKKIQENRVYYYKHDKNKGGSAARNTGISLAKGEYIAFQDSDDEWLPEKLEKQIGVFNNQTKNVGVVYTGFYRIEGNNKTYTII